jgi:hypothetical protein
VRVDNYYWLRDDERTSPAVLSNLAAENDYAAAAMADTQSLQEQLYDEMKVRSAAGYAIIPVISMCRMIRCGFSNSIWSTHVKLHHLMAASAAHLVRQPKGTLAPPPPPAAA